MREEIHHETPLKILEVDAITRLEDINPDLMAFVEKMQPFGEGNPEPALCCQGFEVERLRVLKNCHLQMRLRQGSAVVNAIGFNLVEPNQEVLPPERLVFTPRWNHWQGNRRLQLDILDYC